MGKTHAYILLILGILLALGWFVVSRAGGPADVQPGEAPAGTGVVGGPASPSEGQEVLPADATVLDDVVYTPEDVRIFHEIMTWGRENRMDTLAIGEIIVRTGRRFVGNPYTPQTLDPPGPERVVVNLREFDCVTYVESVLALAHMIQDRRSDFESYVELLRRIRYRDGELDGYISRLHYFSEWIADNEALGLVRDITPQLGGRPVNEAIDFMSTNAEAYPNLDGHPDRIAAIREVEREISGRSRSYIPRRAIAGVADEIRNGDVIAATSSVEGLDIAHTGFALWVDGRLHLMHAPLVGKSLEISDQPLATRILGIDGQDGIMVARPL
jgi:hypothetical protein